MRVLILAEGDPWDPSASGSGTPASLIGAFRRAGVAVLTGDVEVHGARRHLLAARTVAWPRARWQATFRLGRSGFRMRSAIAAEHARRLRPDAVVQYGSTFQTDVPGVPVFPYCDMTTAFSSRHPRSWGAQLRPVTLQRRLADERLVAGTAARVFTFSDYIRQSFIADLGVSPDRVETVRAGPNLEPEAFALPAGHAARPWRGRILFVGVRFEDKGGLILLDAFRRVRHEFPEATLAVVGPRDLRLSEPGVEVVGRLDKNTDSGRAALIAAYRNADVFCLPTLHEPFGIAILEAMHFGLPVVATRLGAIPDMLPEAALGSLVPPGDPESLATALLGFLRHPAHAREVGIRAKARATAEFTWDQVAGKMLATIRRTLPGR